MAAPFNILRHAIARRFVVNQTSSKLISRLSSNKSSDGSKPDSVQSPQQEKSKLDLAKPGRARIQKTQNVPPGPEEEGLGKEVVTAVNAIADAVGKSSSSGSVKLKSDLLKKLQEQRAKSSDDQKKSAVSSLLSGMKVDSNASMTRDTPSDWRSKGSGPRHQDVNVAGQQRLQHEQHRVWDGIDYRLFDGPALGIFKKSTASIESDQQPRKSVFDVIEEEERERLMSMPPNNAFEEMIRWTKEGKLWKFPIDNEQGMDEEANTGFHEHVFLEQHLGEFPKKGPVRIFMELVAIGMSKNPYFTAQEKRENIAWFAEYFKDKYHLIEDASGESETSTLN